jgi:hypothetical protein
MEARETLWRRVHIKPHKLASDIRHAGVRPRLAWPMQLRGPAEKGRNAEGCFAAPLIPLENLCKGRGALSRRTLNDSTSLSQSIVLRASRGKALRSEMLKQKDRSAMRALRNKHDVFNVRGRFRWNEALTKTK